MTHCMYRDAVILIRFLLSPYILAGIYNSVQNCTARWPAMMERESRKFVLF
jgi:hypothetical protein